MPIPKSVQRKSLNIRKALNELQTVIKKAEREKIYKGFLKEIPGGTLSLFSEDGRQKFKNVYLDNRIAGVGKSESLQITTTLITRSFKNNKLIILKGIEKAVKKITNRLKKAEFLGDEESIEEFPEGDENIEKAEEGDTKSIFGKPATFRGGKWVVDEGGGTKKEPEGEKPGKEKLTPADEDYGNTIEGQKQELIDRSEELFGIPSEEYQDWADSMTEEQVVSEHSEAFGIEPEGPEGEGATGERDFSVDQPSDWVEGEKPGKEKLTPADEDYGNTIEGQKQELIDRSEELFGIPSEEYQDWADSMTEEQVVSEHSEAFGIEPEGPEGK